MPEEFKLKRVFEGHYGNSLVSIYESEGGEYMEFIQDLLRHAIDSEPEYSKPRLNRTMTKESPSKDR